LAHQSQAVCDLKVGLEALGGFDSDYENIQMQALDFGYNALRTKGSCRFTSKDF
jgi:hypothetical protein